MQVVGYHYTHSSLQQILPKLLEKILAADQQVVIVMDNDAQLREIDTYLWTYSKSNLLPHGMAEDGNAHLQPIWLSTTLENPNSADVLVWLNPFPPAHIDMFKKVLILQPEWNTSLKTWLQDHNTRTLWNDANGKWESIAI